MKDPANSYIKRFRPLLNDEETLTELLHDLGGPTYLRFEEPYLIDLTKKKKVMGALVTLRTSDDYDAFRDSQEAEEEVMGPQKQDGLVKHFIPQTIDNACGLIAVLNLAVNLEAVSYGELRYAAVDLHDCHTMLTCYSKIQIAKSSS